MFMGEPLSLKLSFSLCSSPIVFFKPSNVFIGSLRNEGTRTNSSVAPISGLALTMTFEQDDGMAGIELGEGEVFNVREDCIEQELKVVNRRIATIQKMKSTNAVEVGN